MQAPKSQTLSFLNSSASTSTPACVSLNSLVQQLNDHQAINEISFLIILSMCEGNHLQISQEIHTHSKQSNLKNVARVFLLYLGQNIKLHISYGLRAELEILQKKTFYPTFDRSSLILDRSSQTELHNEFYNNSIQTLYKTHTLSKFKTKLKTCFDHGLQTIQIRVLIHQFLSTQNLTVTFFDQIILLQTQSTKFDFFYVGIVSKVSYYYVWNLFSGKKQPKTKRNGTCKMCCCA